MTWAAQPRSERPLEVDDVLEVEKARRMPGETIASTDDDEILESLIDNLSSERPASLGCAGPHRHFQTKTDIAAC
jgi:hypothetical protein